jgi:16S rRNA (cytidine1402-2'-O)-methyltransferase
MIVKIPASESPSWLAEDKHRANGEFVIALCPAPELETTPQVSEAKRWLDALAKELPPARAAKIVAKMTGVPRDELYRSLAGDGSEGA